MSNEPTTAEILGQYRRDLEAEGFQPDIVSTLVLDAAHVGLQRRLLTVSAGESCSGCCPKWNHRHLTRGGVR